MEGDVCPRCKHPEVSYDPKFGRICENCGLVVEESVVSLEVELSGVGDDHRPVGVLVSQNESGGGLHYSRTQFSQRAIPLMREIDSEGSARAEAYRKLQKIASNLRLSNALVNQMKHLLGRAVSGRYGHGRRAELLAAAVAYVVCRQNGKSFTLLDVADIVQCNVFVLGRVYTQLLSQLEIQLPTVDPRTYIDRACSRLSLSERQAAIVRKHATQLVTVAERDWLLTGRHPGAVAAAAIMLALEINSVQVDTKLVSDALHVSDRTVKMRVKELQQSLVKECQCLPWGKDVSVKNVVPHLPFLLKYYEVLRPVMHKTKHPEGDEETDPPDAPGAGSLASGFSITSSVSELSEALVRKVQQGEFPPSYRSGMLQRERRRVKLERAKRRLAETLRSLGHSSTTTFPPPDVDTTDPTEGFESLRWLKNVKPKKKRKHWGEMEEEKDREEVTPTPTAQVEAEAETIAVPQEDSTSRLASWMDGLSEGSQRQESSLTEAAAEGNVPSVQAEDDEFAEFFIGRSKRRLRLPKPSRPGKTVLGLSTEGDTLDEEDLVLEKLLLQGVDEEKILEGYYMVYEQEDAGQEGGGVDSTELGDQDIPEEQLGLFLKTPAEVEATRRIHDAVGSHEGKEGKEATSTPHL